MTIDNNVIEKVAVLAKLKLDESSINEVTQSIADILAMVDKMQSVNTEGIVPMANPLDASQRFRADRVTEQNDRDSFQALTSHAEEGLYLVPKVIE